MFSFGSMQFFQLYWPYSAFYLMRFVAWCSFFSRLTIIIIVFVVIVFLSLNGYSFTLQHNINLIIKILLLNSHFLFHPQICAAHYNIHSLSANSNIRRYEEYIYKFYCTFVRVWFEILLRLNHFFSLKFVVCELYIHRSKLYLQ